MNQQLSILNLFAPKGKGSSIAHKRIVFLVGLSTALLVILVGYVVVSASEPAVKNTGEAFLAANPELMVAHRYVGPVIEEGDAALLAANPELMVARRYIGSVEQGIDTFLDEE